MTWDSHYNTEVHAQVFVVAGYFASVLDFRIAPSSF